MRLRHSPLGHARMGGSQSARSCSAAALPRRARREVRSSPSRPARSSPTLGAGAAAAALDAASGRLQPRPLRQAILSDLSGRFFDAANSSHRSASSISISRVQASRAVSAWARASLARLRQCSASCWGMAGHPSCDALVWVGAWWLWAMPQTHIRFQDSSARTAEVGSNAGLALVFPVPATAQAEPITVHRVHHPDRLAIDHPHSAAAPSAAAITESLQLAPPGTPRRGFSFMVSQCARRMVSEL
jgi:hypothetical protein